MKLSARKNATLAGYQLDIWTCIIKSSAASTQFGNYCIGSINDNKMGIKTICRNIKYRLRPALYWANGSIRNWGDDLNPWLYEKLTGKRPIYCPHPDVPRLLMAGSILTQAGHYDECWGTGLLQPCRAKRLNLRKAHAVRGQLTAEELTKSEIEPPQIFGDPGLLATSFVNIDPTKHYKVAIIPHYVDLQDAKSLAHEREFKIIDVGLPIDNFMHRVAAAEYILSSSLHGIICAESLGIPAIWMRFSDRLIGGNFKFHDYLSGTNRKWENIKPVDVRRRELPEAKLFEQFAWPAFDVDFVKDRLMQSFPHRL